MMLSGFALQNNLLLINKKSLKMNHRIKLALCLWLLHRRRKRKRKMRRVYVKEPHIKCGYNRFRKFHLYYADKNPTELEHYLRLQPHQLDHFFCLIKDYIPNHNLNHRFPISAKERVAVFLRFLSHGSSLVALSHEFGIGHTTVYNTVEEISSAIIDALSSKLLPVPSRKTWETNINRFENIWGFPHVLAAVDGKHFAICAPSGTGSAYYNYKSFHSLVLLAFVDPDYRFLMVDIGAPGRQSDRSLLSSSAIQTFIDSDESELPLPSPLGNFGSVPYYFLADGGFTLSDRILTPFTYTSSNTRERINYNRKLSKARQVTENSFGQLVTRFRLFTRTMNFNVVLCKKLMLCGVLLHNYLRNVEIEHGQQPIAVADHDYCLESLSNPNLRITSVCTRAKIFRDRVVNYLECSNI